MSSTLKSREKLLRYLAAKPEDEMDNYLLDKLDTEANLYLQQGEIKKAISIICKVDEMTPFLAKYAAMAYYKKYPQYVSMDKKNFNLLIGIMNFEQAKQRNFESKQKVDADWGKSKAEMSAISPLKWIFMILAVAKLLHIIWNVVN